MQIIPAMDIIDGQCVRLSQGSYASKKVYAADPLEQARRFEQHGLTRLHVVDLDGARQHRIVNHRVLRSLCEETSLVIDFGGGVKSTADLELAFDCGAAQVTAGTVAVKQPDLFLEWLARFGAERIILGADVKEGRVAISGWEQQSELELLPFLRRYHRAGVSHVICTEISRDGMLAGSAVELYGEVRNELPDLKLIASGGVTSLEELRALHDLGCHGAIVGKALYEGPRSLEDRKGVEGLGGGEAGSRSIGEERQ